jgi:hypothetical protein
MRTGVSITVSAAERIQLEAVVGDRNGAQRLADGGPPPKSKW